MTPKRPVVPFSARWLKNRSVRRAVQCAHLDLAGAGVEQALPVGAGQVEVGHGPPLSCSRLAAPEARGPGPHRLATSAGRVIWARRRRAGRRPGCRAASMARTRAGRVSDGPCQPRGPARGPAGGVVKMGRNRRSSRWRTARLVGDQPVEMGAPGPVVGAVTWATSAPWQMGVDDARCRAENPWRARWRRRCPGCRAPRRWGEAVEGRGTDAAVAGKDGVALRHPLESG